ncbi:MAG: hypothetical protein Q7U74_10115, partial [Saprospiraceae bacterium]|nr:hypothetical protein [Saprospiraceae bacterium]
MTNKNSPPYTSTRRKQYLEFKKGGLKMATKKMIVLSVILTLLLSASYGTAQTTHYKLSVVLSELSPWYEGA